MKFRFQDLQIWQFAVEILDELLDILIYWGIKSFIDLPNN